MNELNHTNGKGSVERPGNWRAGYDQIDWHRTGDKLSGGFKRGSMGIRKVYKQNTNESTDTTE